MKIFRMILCLSLFIGLQTGQDVQAAEGGKEPDKPSVSLSVPLQRGPASFRMTNTNLNVVEGQGMISVGVVRDGDPTAPSDVFITTFEVAGGATSDVDFQSLQNFPLQFMPGETGPKFVNVVIIEDTEQEPSEDFKVSIVDVSNGGIGTPSDTIVTIDDNDMGPAGQLQFVAATFQILEGNVTLSINIERVGGASGAVSVEFSTVALAGGATPKVDYFPVTNFVVNFPDGQTGPFKADVDIFEDMEVEGDEDFQVVLSNPTGGAGLGNPSTAIVTIQDNDLGQAGEIQFSANGYTVNEGDGFLVAVVERVNGDSGMVSAEFNTFPGVPPNGANPGSDYTTTSLAVSFADGDSAPKMINIPIIDDGAPENTETFILDLNNPTGGAAIGNPFRVNATIIDNDGSISFGQIPAIVDENAGQASFEVFRTGSLAGAASVTFSTIPVAGGATPNADYQSVNTQVNFANGDGGPKTVIVPIFDDVLVEGNEDFRVALSNPTGAGLGTPREARITIRDNDSVIRLTDDHYSAGEGSLGVTVTVERIGVSNQTVSVTLSTVAINGGATPGQDYQNRTLNVSFPAGAGGNQAVTIPFFEDNLVEGNESFGVSLSNPSAGTMLGNPSQAEVTIIDNDVGAPGQLVLTASRTVNEDAGSVNAIVSRVGGSAGTLTAEVETREINNGATSNLDFQSVRTTVTFPNGDETPKTVAIPILDDALVEPNEDFIVEMTTGDGVAEQVQITILDNDEPGEPGEARLSNSRYLVDENEGMLRVEILREGGADGALEVLLSTLSLSGQATPNVDFTEVMTPVLFENGDIGPRVVEIPILDDNLSEGDEDFAVVLSATGDNALGSPTQALCTILDDDEQDQGALKLARSTYSIGETEGVVPIEIERIGGTGGSLIAELFTTAINGGAVPGQDYTPIMATVLFNDGERGPKIVNIPILDDDLIEGDESFVVELASPDGATSIVPPTHASITIRDDDVIPDSGTLVFDRPRYAVGEGVGMVTVSISRVGGGLGTLTATLNTVAGTAEAGTDFTPVSETIAFEDGETGERTVQIPIIDDIDPEEAEGFGLVLNGVSGKRMADHSSASVLIFDNDQLSTIIVSPRPEDGPFLLGQEINFRAEATGAPDGEDVQFFWEICTSAGDACVILQGQEFTQTPPAAARYQISCFARAGSRIDLTPARIFIEVVDRLPPTANIIRPEQDQIFVSPGTTVQFEAERGPSDVSGEWFLLSDSGRKTPGFTFEATFHRLQRFTVVFRATAPDGAHAADYVNVVVTSDGMPPPGLRIASPRNGDVVNVGEPVQFQGELQGTDASKKEFELGWVLSDGTVLEGANPTYIFGDPGRVTVRFVGRDGDRKRLFDEVSILVRDPSQPPLLDFNFPTDLEIEPGESVFFKAKGLRDRGYRRSDISYSWNFGDGRTSQLPVPGNIRFDEEGEFTVTLFARVGETGLQTPEVTRTIRVVSSAPDRFEPDNTFEQAAPIKPGRYDNQVLDNDVDIYQIQVISDGQRIVLALELTGSVLAEVFSALNLETPISSRIIESLGNLQVEGLSPGDYFLKLTPLDDGQTKRRAVGYSLGVSVLNPALFFPDIQLSETMQTQIGVVNPTGGDVSLEAVGFDAQGNIVDTVQLDLPPQGRTHQGLEQLFGDEAGEVAWIQIDATRELVGYSRTESRDQREVYGLTAGVRLSSELYVPHIAERVEQWYTRASVINGTNQSSASQILTPASETDLQLDRAFAKDSFDFLDRFQGELPETAVWATFKDTGEKPSLAGAEIFGMLSNETRVIAGLQLIDIRQDNPNFTYIGNNLYFTHIARDVNTFWTGIALVNIGEIAQTVKVRAFGPDGVEVGDGKDIVLASGEKRVEVAETFLEGLGSPANIDWIRVEADQEIVGFELFGTHDFQRIAGLEATTGLKSQICYPFMDTSDDVVHGISVVNVNPEDVTVTFTLYDNEGSPLDERQQVLSPNQKISILIEDLFDDTVFSNTQIPGWLECSSTRPLAGFELFVNTANGEQMGALIAQ